GDDQLCVAAANRLHRVHHGAETRAAHAVHGLARRLDWQARLDRRLPRDIHPGARLQDAAEDHLADRCRLDMRARHRLAYADGPKLTGTPILERATERSDRRAARACNHDLRRMICQAVLVKILSLSV